MSVSKTNLRTDIIKRFMPMEDFQKLMFEYELAKKRIGGKSIELPEDFATFGKALVKKEMTIDEVAEHYKKTKTWVGARYQKFMQDRLISMGL